MVAWALIDGRLLSRFPVDDVVTVVSGMLCDHQKIRSARAGQPVRFTNPALPARRSGRAFRAPLLVAAMKSEFRKARGSIPSKGASSAFHSL
jgi:hypothetical protein